MKPALTKEQARRRVQRQTKLLREIIEDAAAWRGQYTGHEGADQVLKEFDRRINKAKEALSELANLAWERIS